jgi:hypothetical protein
MSITRRQAIAVLAGAVPALRGIYALAREAPQSLRFRRARFTHEAHLPQFVYGEFAGGAPAIFTSVRLQHTGQTPSRMTSHHAYRSDLFARRHKARSTLSNQISYALRKTKSEN